MQDHNVIGALFRLICLDSLFKDVLDETHPILVVEIRDSLLLVSVLLVLVVMVFVMVVVVVVVDCNVENNDLQIPSRGVYNHYHHHLHRHHQHHHHHHHQQQ
mmetsp:Transcript_15807/g.39161  ORF Transcript_15807/g.39161 Transcript_15807/m.39161 type:complete len:102 (-) Transcript_15807:52-357(-)